MIADGDDVFGDVVGRVVDVQVRRPRCRAPSPDREDEAPGDEAEDRRQHAAVDARR
jgi:hypothetical protein